MDSHKNRALPEQCEESLEQPIEPGEPEWAWQGRQVRSMLQALGQLGPIQFGRSGYHPAQSQATWVLQRSRLFWSQQLSPMNEAE